MGILRWFGVGARKVDPRPVASMKMKSLVERNGEFFVGKDRYKVTFKYVDGDLPRVSVWASNRSTLVFFEESVDGCREFLSKFSQLIDEVERADGEGPQHGYDKAKGGDGVKLEDGKLGKATD
jgi:hypothetical protein